MKVLLLFSSSELGGAERSLTRMACASQAINYHLGTLDGEGPWTEWVRSLDKEPLVFGQRKKSHGSFSFLGFYKLIKYTKQHNIDVIYVCGLRASFYLRLLSLILPKIKIIHGVRWNPTSESRLDVAFRFLESKLSHLIDLYVVNSQASQETLIHKCKISSEKVKVVYNGIETFPAEIPTKNSRILEVLTVANLSRRKGHLEYLEVIKRITNNFPNVRFVFVGRDDMHGEIQETVKHAKLDSVVSFAGFQADVSQYYSRANLFVLPSIWGEGCPTSILESMSWAVPVVAFDTDGVKELVYHGEDGYLAKSGDYESLYQHILALLSNSELNERFGLNGREKVMNNFTIQKCAHEHGDILHSLST